MRHREPAWSQSVHEIGQEGGIEIDRPASGRESDIQARGFSREIQRGLRAIEVRVLRLKRDGALHGQEGGSMEIGAAIAASRRLQLEGPSEPLVDEGIGRRRGEQAPEIRHRCRCERLRFGRGLLAGGPRGQESARLGQSGLRALRGRRLDPRGADDPGHEPGRQAEGDGRGHDPLREPRSQRAPSDDLDGNGPRAGEARVHGRGCEPETRRGQDAVGGNARGKVDRAVDEEGDDGAERADGDADAEGITPLGVRVAAHGAAATTEKMSAQEVAGDPSRRPEGERRPQRSRLDQELEEIAVRVRKVHVPGAERRGLEVEEGFLVGAQPHPEGREDGQHGQGRLPLEHATERVGRAHAMEQRAEPDPETIAQDHRAEGACQGERASKATETGRGEQAERARHGQAHEGAAAQRQDHGEGHESDAEGG